MYHIINQLKNSTMKNQKTVFEKLKTMNVPYSVGIAKTRLKGAYDITETYGSDYFIVVPFNTENHILDELGFSIKNFPSHKQCVEYTMDDEDINLFKESLHNYKMVSNLSSGIIYEPLHCSLKQYLNNKNN